MKAIVFEAARRMRVAELPIPEPGENELLVRNGVCAICNATDTKLYQGNHALARFPLIPGHEAAGVVVAAGKNVTGFSAGDAVLGGGYPGTENMPAVWGAYAEYGIVRKEEVIRIPDGVSAEEAACCHMLAEALNAVNIGEVRSGENIMIIGAGAVGLSLLTLLKLTSAGSITVMDVAQEKLQLACEHGATAAFDPGDPELKEKISRLTQGRGIQKIFEAVGQQHTYDFAFDMIGDGGKIVAFGMMEHELVVPFRKLYARQAELCWCRNAGTAPVEHRQVVLEMMRRGQIDAGKLITHRVTLETLDKGFEAIAQGKQIRVIITMNQNEVM